MLDFLLKKWGPKKKKKFIDATIRIGRDIQCLPYAGFFFLELQLHLVFKRLALLADSFYKSKCPSVCLSVRPSVRPCFRLYTFEHRLNVFLPPHPKVGCPKTLKIRKPWGKVMERSGLRLKTFTNEECKIAPQKKKNLGKFCLTEQDFFGIGATIHIGREILHLCGILTMSINLHLRLLIKLSSVQLRKNKSSTVQSLHHLLCC